jgi:hypothetical protein
MCENVERLWEEILLHCELNWSNYGIFMSLIYMKLGLVAIKLILGREWENFDETN